MSLNKPMYIDFRKPANLSELAVFIGVSETALEQLNQPNKTVRFFHQHHIPKSSSKRTDEYRTVWEASNLVDEIYKAFARRFDLFLRTTINYPHPAAYGYVRGRSTLDNARGHCRAPYILHADITDFFPSITRDRIKKILVQLGLQEKVVEILGNILTIEESLPLGLHPSPMLANIICLDLDNKLNELSKNYGCLYTRYADDITISGTTIPNKDEIKKILASEGFLLSERKFRITKPGQAHYVTGLSVTDSIPRAPRHMKQRIRQELYYCEKYGIEEHLQRIDGGNNFLRRGINRIDGTIRYISSIEGGLQPDLKIKWNNLLNNSDLRPSYETIPKLDTIVYNFYIDETEIEFGDVKYLALCFVQINTAELDSIEATTTNILRRAIIDPFAGGHKKALQKKKLHYTDANKNLQKTYIDELSLFPYKSYLAYGELTDAKNYSELYIELIKKILPYRLMACDGASVKLIFEENPKLSSLEIKNTVTDIYGILRKSRNRRPKDIEVEIGKKAEHPCFSMPDFLLGIFAKYAKLNLEPSEPKELNNLLFEKLRDKYRVILDIDNNIIYSRKRPFLPLPETN